jgi:arginine deiminase
VKIYPHLMSSLIAKVSSDIAPLRKVLIHRPDEGVETVTPTNAAELLYDDIVYLPEMQREHDVFTNLLRSFLGNQGVLELQELLEEILEDYTIREDFLECLYQLEGMLEKEKSEWESLDAKSLAYAVFTGFLPIEKKQLSAAVPNLIFTRDIGVTIENSLLTCHARKKPRKRESLITWFVFHHHPIFKNLPKSDLSNTCTELLEILMKDTDVSVEGGDVMMLFPGHLLIAYSQRTSPKAVNIIKEMLFESGEIHTLTVATIPQENYCMHIDTIFSRIHHHDYVVYAPILLDGNMITLRTYKKGDIEPRTYPTIKEFLEEYDPQYRILLCANGDYPHDRREQWTSACNFVAIREGVLITYRRNIRTMEMLKKAGYDIVDGEKLLLEFEAGTKDPASLNNTIIYIPSGELSRAGGGPHCLTMPLVRG